MGKLDLDFLEEIKLDVEEPVVKRCIRYRRREKGREKRRKRGRRRSDREKRKSKINTSKNNIKRIIFMK